MFKPTDPSHLSYEDRLAVSDIINEQWPEPFHVVDNMNGNHSPQRALLDHDNLLLGVLTRIIPEDYETPKEGYLKIAVRQELSGVTRAKLRWAFALLAPQLNLDPSGAQCIASHVGIDPRTLHPQSSSRIDELAQMAFHF